MNLKDKIIKIESHCNSNSISLFRGTFDDTNFSIVNWETFSQTEKQNDLDKYLQSTTIVGSKILVLYTEENDFDFHELEKIIKDSDEEEKEVLLKSFEIVKNNKDDVPFFELAFFYNNICFRFSELSDWMNNFIEIRDFVNNYYDDKNEDYQDNFSELIDYNSNQMSDEEIEKLARELVYSEEYLKAETYNERHALVLKTTGSFYNRKLLDKKCNEIYRNEIVAKQEEELRLKVIDLKKQGLKKVEIASKLGISAGRVNKYFYTD